MQVPRPSRRILYAGCRPLLAGRSSLLVDQTTNNCSSSGIPILPIYCLFLSKHTFLCARSGFGATFDLKERRVSMAKHKDASGEVRVIEMRTELARKIADRAVAEGDTSTEIPGLMLYRRSAPTACASAAYEPSLVVFAQGRKRINVGKTTYLTDGSNFLLTSIDLPVVSQVISATEKKRYSVCCCDLKCLQSGRFSRSRSFICARNPRTRAAWRSASLRSNFWMHV